MMASERAKAAATNSQRRFRERKNTGALSATANVPVRLWRKLIRRGFISEAEIHDQYALGRALIADRDET